MTGKLLITFNAGSSTVKIGLFALGRKGAERIGKGMIDFRRAPLRFTLSEGPDTFDIALEAEAGDDLHEVVSEAFSRLSWHFDLDNIAAIGHRVVHGGDGFAGPVRLDDDAIAAIDALTPLAPLHQPQGLRLIRALRHLRPQLPQTASFDTAFHRDHADVVRRFAIPRALHDQGIKRYGFHGLSYKFIAAELARREPALAGSKVVVAHLGSGASLCGLDGGVSRDTSMGFSALDGVPMATRCGAIDPGVLLHLIGTQGRGVKDVEDILYRQSGLLGVSGISADSRELLESERLEASQALDLFSFRIAGEIARLATTLGGLDAIVFTAGVGENQPRIRAAVSARLAWLGLTLDEPANAANTGTISTASSAISALVIATDEEQVIADEALLVLGIEGTSP
ncbi:acetate/propionate family kinase [Bosea sp. (in: a-proteobacteria)]|uniref:acetate/propionate family kinase n=1 Tax=Bosea sp. (in: a-proteobacteria) TaxID=1871050 RepID=UPI0027374990|nr:acetate/propionate family kinase [Bosea sp. (in: a-proteobacteria)]MDP3256723.1 acetate/propionate family kinase [Bosea sp. (in: a-proteobacteria)]